MTDQCNYEETQEDGPEKIDEQQLFDRYINVLIAQEALKEDMKALSKLGKANEIKTKITLAAAKLFVKNTFEEKVAESKAVEDKYKELTEYE